MRPALLVFTGFATVALLSACKREQRQFSVPNQAAEMVEAIPVSPLQPGGQTTQTVVKNEYEENAYAMSQGQHLFRAFNCNGCHSSGGGGGMGPPLIDQKWIYGSQPEQIFATIVQGRPNGMPSFRGKIPEYQVWQLVAYVRSMSGLVSSAAAPSREDRMKAQPPASSMPKEQPTSSSMPKPAEIPM